jgi:protein ImuB
MSDGNVPAERVVTLRCPDWPAMAATAATAATVATGDVGPVVVLQADRVVARDAAAAGAGIRVGQRRRQVQRALPGARLVAHDPDRDARAFEVVVRAVAELVPRVDVVEPGWLAFAARGPARYFGGEAAFAERLSGLVGPLLGGVSTGGVSTGGVSTGIAIADGRAISAILAVQVAQGVQGDRSSVLIVPVGRSAAYVADRSLRALLELHEDTAELAELIDLLHRLGITTFGALAELPAVDVLARFGPLGVRVHRIARGVDDEPLRPTEPPPERWIERVFEDPVVQVEPVVFVAKQLVDELVATLSAAGTVCTRLVVVVETEHGERSERSWYRHAGLTAAAMVDRVRWQLDAWVGEIGAVTSGIVLLRLVPATVRRADGEQVGFWGGRSAADADAVRAVTRLVSLMGEQGVLVPTWRGGRLPGDRVAWVPAGSVDLDDPARCVFPPGAAEGAGVAGMTDASASSSSLLMRKPTPRTVWTIRRSGATLSSLRRRFDRWTSTTWVSPTQFGPHTDTSRSWRDATSVGRRHRCSSSENSIRVAGISSPSRRIS